MGEVRVAMIGGGHMFPGLMNGLQDGVSMFNDLHGTLHQVGLMAASQGIGASSHVPYPHIIVSRARVGSDDCPVSTVETVCRLLEPCRGFPAHRAFILDDIQDQADRDELRLEYHQREFSGQVRVYAPYNQETYNRFGMAVISHLNDVLQSFDQD